MVVVARKTGGIRRESDSGVSGRGVPGRGVPGRARGRREKKLKMLAPYAVSERARRLPPVTGKSGLCPSQKLRYSTEVDAAIGLENARKVRRIKRSDYVEVRYYECPDCRGYHLTSQPERGVPEEDA